MSTVTEHYAAHLAPIYLWMAGGPEAALRAGTADIDALNLSIADGTSVVDLGAGFGMHAIPLARCGARVVAIDTSAELLRTLAQLAGGLPVEVVNDDLLAFERHVTARPSAILCMGDTIAHLPDTGAVERLVASASSALPPGGTFVLSFRDYSTALVGDRRFIPVRSDDTRILTCFLEYESEALRVHDILHERTPDGWHTRVSHYRKLRLSPAQLIASLEANGFDIGSTTGMRGMVCLVAQRV